MFLDGRAPATHRASVQALFLVASTGLPSLLGSLTAGEWLRRTDLGADAWVFLVPCILNGALLMYFTRGFRSSQVSTAERPGASRAGVDAGTFERIHAMRGATASVGDLVTESADG